MHPGTDAQTPEPDGLPPDIAGVVAVYLGTFAPRHDLHNRWDARAGHYVIPHDHSSAEGCTGRDDDGCPTARLTAGIVWHAFQHRGTVGAYHPGADGYTNVGVIDIDRDDGADIAAGIARTFGAAGLGAYIEPSREGRAHLWLSGPMLPARVWTFALLAGMTASGYPATTATDLARRHGIELRPDGSGGYGKAMRLPGMVNPKDGKRYPMLAPDGSPLGTKVAEWLGAIEQATDDAVVTLAEQHRLPEPEPIRRERSAAARDFERDTDAISILAALGITQAAPGRSVRCPFHDDRRASLAIARDGRRVWCHSPGCRAHGDNGRGLGVVELALAVVGAA
jgi:hypothetical protein